MDSNFKRKNDSHNYKGRKKFKDERSSNGRLDKETYEYFSRIADVLNHTIDEEEMAILATNTMQQTQGIEADVCKHTVAASVLGTIIPYASWSEIQRIIAALDGGKEDVRANCESRVEEAIIREAGRRIRLDECEDKEECLLYLTNKSERILEHFENGIWDQNTNFTARTCLSVCSGYEDKGKNLVIISKKVIKKFSKKLMSWSELSDAFHHNLISGFLQILLFSLKAFNGKSTKKFAKFLIQNCFLKDFENQTEGFIIGRFENVSWSRLLEATIEVSPPELQEEIYQKLFFEHIENLVVSKKGHFPVYKLITSCTEKGMFQSILEKLKNKFTDILTTNNLNILYAISEACVNTGEKQGEFIKSLSNALECCGPNKEKHLISCVISMRKLSEVNLEDINVNFHGSLILQNLLKFKKPQKFVEALFSLNVSVLKRILTDPKGCHVTDAFMASSYVGAKSKDRLIQTLKGCYSDLAVDKYGSRSFDVIWAYASMKYRSIILSEMSRQIMKTTFGSFIASKTGLEMYIKDRCAWERAYNSADKTNLFADIIKSKQKQK